MLATLGSTNHADTMFSYLPIPISVAPSMDKEVSGAPSNTTRRSTMALSDIKMLWKVMYLKSDIIEEPLVGLPAKLIFLPCGILYFTHFYKNPTIFEHCMQQCLTFSIPHFLVSNGRKMFEI